MLDMWAYSVKVSRVFKCVKYPKLAHHLDINILKRVLLIYILSSASWIPKMGYSVTSLRSFRNSSFTI